MRFIFDLHVRFAHQVFTSGVYVVLTAHLSLDQPRFECSIGQHVLGLDQHSEHMALWFKSLCIYTLSGGGRLYCSLQITHRDLTGLEGVRLGSAEGGDKSLSPPALSRSLGASENLPHSDLLPPASQTGLLHPLQTCLLWCSGSVYDNCTTD